MFSFLKIHRRTLLYILTLKARKSSTVVMQRALTRHWRDASTLLLTAKTTSPAPLLAEDHTFEALRPSKNSYEAVESSALSGQNFKSLMLTRSSKSKFMASALVFPGGVVDAADRDASWSSTLERFAGSRPPPASSNLSIEKRPPMIAEAKDSSSFSLDLALRVAAIRETFEEVGILLVANAEGSAFVDMDAAETTRWRRAVQDNAANFMRLCEEFKVAPDVWRLHEWSNWLTPVGLSLATNRSGKLDPKNDKKPIRFDTLFYVATLDEMPTYFAADEGEIVKAQWLDSRTALNLHFGGQLWMPPPQMYEHSRLLRFSDFDKLRDFCPERETRGIPRWQPVAKQCKDGVVTVYPGDELYPKNSAFDFNVDVLPEFDGTMKELRLSTSSHNRMEFKGEGDYRFFVNLDDPGESIQPLSLVPRKQ